MKRFYSILLCIHVMLISVACLAQDAAGAGQPEMATGMRSSGKIYVVVAVVVTILLGLVIYLIRLDKRISRLEKEPPVS